MWTLPEKWELGIVSETADVFLYNCVIFFLIFARVGLAVFIRVKIMMLSHLFISSSSSCKKATSAKHTVAVVWKRCSFQPWSAHGPISTSLLLAVADLFSEIIADLVNSSFSEGRLTAKFKSASNCIRQHLPAIGQFLI